MSAGVMHAAELESLARKAWGEPNARYSTRDDLRFGKHGSKSVKLKAGTWYDHEANEGGGYRDLYMKVNGSLPPNPTIAAEYDYRDTDGALLFQVVRLLPKKFRQRRPDGNGGWTWTTRGVKRVLYRLPELLAADPVQPVFIAEGEKDVDALRALGLIATCNPGGAGKWGSELGVHLQGRHIVTLPDNDQVGREHAADVQRRLRPYAASVRGLALPGLPEKGDVSDWIAAGGTAELLMEMLSAAESDEYAQEEARDLEPFAIINPATLHQRTVPVRDWIVPEWLPVNHVTADYGDGGTGKTLLAQQLQTACSTGTYWCGLAVTRCRTLGLYCEDDTDELHRRQETINETFGLNYRDLSEMRWVSGLGQDCTLARFTSDGRMHETDRYRWLEREAVGFGARLVVLDTAADLFGGNENDRHQVRAFVGLLNRLALRIGGSVLLNAHPSRSGLASGNLDGGSTAWSNSVRSRWSLARPDAERPDPNARVLARRKANYACAGDTIHLRWVRGVLVPQRTRTITEEQTYRAGPEMVFLDLLERCDELNMPLSATKQAGNFAPRIFAKRTDSQGYTAKEFDVAMSALFTAQRIELIDYGRKGDERRRIARKPQPTDDAGIRE